MREGAAREQASDRVRMREKESRWGARVRETSAAVARRGRFTSSMAAVVGRRRMPRRCSHVAAVAVR
jgi:hypothetical protein